jgi:hypothetical protein
LVPQVAGISNVFTPVQWDTVTASNGIVFLTGSCVVSKSGLYHLTAGLTVRGALTDTVTTDIVVNGLEVPFSRAVTDVGAAETKTLTFDKLLSLSAGDLIGLQWMQTQAPSAELFPVNSAPSARMQLVYVSQP